MNLLSFDGGSGIGFMYGTYVTLTLSKTALELYAD